MGMEDDIWNGVRRIRLECPMDTGQLLAVLAAPDHLQLLMWNDHSERAVLQGYRGAAGLLSRIR